jgi:hypothetical protein
MPSAQMWSGVTQGLSQVSKDMSTRELRDAQLAEAKNKQQLSQQQLQEFQQGAPGRQRTEDLQLQQLEAQTRKINQQALTSTTMSALDRFNSDGSARHLNVLLSDAKKNPVGMSLYSNVSRYDNLVKSDANDKLLKQAGYTPDDVYGDPDLADDLLVMTSVTGEQRLLPRETMYVATGYNNYLDDKQLATMERKARISQMMRGGQSKAKVTMQERVVQSLIDEGRANNVAEAYELLQKIDAGDQKMLSSTEERQVEKIMQDAKDAGKPISNLEALDQYYNARRQGSGVTNEERFVQDYLDNNEGSTREEATSAYRNLAKTSTQKEVTDVKELRVGLDEMNWLESKPSEMSGTERAKVYRDYISPLEDLRNFKLSTEDKRTVRSLRNLTALGGTAGTELTPDETGLLDSTLNSFKKYIFDEVGGKKATASYETFRNVFRNALYGASLTKPEIESFNKAAGTLGQKFQPVMQQLQVQMSTIKNNLEAIRDLNDPDIAHYYTGQSIEQIDDAIAAIEDRMDNPSLRLKDVAKGQGLKVRKVQKDAKATVPDVNKTVDFDFDAAMKGAGL